MFEIIHLEAATGGVLHKKVFLKISQNSRENTCARVFFNKVAGLGLFTKHLWATALIHLKFGNSYFHDTLLYGCFVL